MQYSCIVIPCYNEEKRLPLNDFMEFINTNDNVHLFFVNDGSSDFTLGILNELKAKKENQISVLNLESNKGKAEAVRQGILEAKKQNQFSVIGFLDADLSTPLYEASRLISLFEDHVLFIFGSRVKRIGAEINRKLYRHLFGRVFATFASQITKLGVYDTQCGAKFFKTEIVDDLFLEKFKSNWIFDLELFIRFTRSQKNQNIHNISKEIPLKYWDEKGGSKIKPIHLVKLPFNMLNLYYQYK